MAKILIVEDDTNIAFGLEHDLKLEGYEIEVVSDGERAIERALEGSFDLIILDVMLPKKDGFEVVRELRLGGLKTPIIMLTAKAQEAEKVLGLELGADDYVTKPFSPLELRARVKARLRRGQESAEETFRFGDCAVDFRRFEIRRSGEFVSTTPIEFKILTALIRNRGRVLERDQLLDLVWGPGTAITERVVDTHIANLRKKIESNPSRPRHLISVRGLGYRFEI
jgi:two-component system alkaline phosphatase synthesis response regulator PhoP